MATWVYVELKDKPTRKFRSEKTFAKFSKNNLDSITRIQIIPMFGQSVIFIKNEDNSF